MNPSTISILITLYFAVALLTLYWAVRSIRRYLRKSVKRIRKQRNQDLRFHRDSLLAHMRLEQASKH
jgi:protein-S-isoprenylcysteine O-methyltransferase Ste14